MSLVELFNKLLPPETSNCNLFNALTLEEFDFVKVAISNEGYPIILISLTSDEKLLPQRNIRLKYIDLTHNKECKVLEGDKTKYATYTVILFKSNQSYLQQYFLSVAETLIKTISSKPLQEEVSKALKGFVEIFRSLSNTPTKEIKGLWSELLVIEVSKHPITLLNYWHCKPREKFDFDADSEKIEVKSSSTLERIHTFASEQLNPPADKQVVVASIFLKQVHHGRTINDLVKSIQCRVSKIELLEKMFSIISATLGTSLEQTIKVKFDYDLAKNSIQYYRHQDISRIETINIPSKVSGVRYESNLTNIKSISPTDLGRNGQLYIAI